MSTNKKSDIERDLSQRWQALWAKIVPEPKDCHRLATREWIKVRDRYTEPHRGYHDLGHISYFLKMLDFYWRLVEDPIALEYAAFRHDELYFTAWRPKALPSNEALSTAAADEPLAEASKSKGSLATREFRNRVCGEIIVTLHDPERYPPQTQDEMVMADIDWSPLGWPWPDFVDSRKGIRHEYSLKHAGYTEEEFLAGTKAFYGKVLERKTQFYLPEFKSRFERQTIYNIERALRELEAG